MNANSKKGITFEYMIERDKHGYEVYTNLKSNGNIFMVGTGTYTSRWSANRGIRRIIKLFDKEIVVINAGKL